MLLRTVSLNRMVSWVTMAICERSEARVRSRTSWPSISKRPRVTSKKRGSRCTSVVLPEPLEPTIATTSPRLDFEVDVVQHLARAVPVLVGEVDMLEADAAMEARQLESAGLLAHIVLGIEEVEDGRGRAQRLLEVVVELPELAHRLVELEYRDDERQEHAFGEDAVLDVFASHQDEHRDGDGAEDVHHGRADGISAHRAQVRLEQTPGGFAEAGGLPGLHGEGLHDADAGDGLLQNVLDVGDLVLAFAGGGADALADSPRRHDDNGNEDGEHPGQASAKQDDHDGGKQEGEELLQEFRHHGGNGVLHAIDVAHNGGQQGAGGMLLEKRHRAPQGGGVEFVAQIGNHAEAGVVGQVGAEVVEHALQDGGGDQRKGHHGPDIVKVLGNEPAQLDGLMGNGHAKQGQIAALGRGIQHPVENGADEQEAKGFEDPDQRHGQHRREYLEPVRLEVSE